MLADHIQVLTPRCVIFVNNIVLFGVSDKEGIKLEIRDLKTHFKNICFSPQHK